MIKITGGKLKGQTLRVTDAENLRPTTSFFREWIFNVLDFHIDLAEINMLDLFCGSGIISMEFLSRGAYKATLVEKNPKVIKQLKENLIKFKIDPRNIRLERDDALRYLKKIISDTVCHHNLIFLDPPYKMEFIQEMLDLIGNKQQIFPEDLIVIIESAANYKLKIPAPFQVMKEKKGGASKLMILTRSE